MGSTQQAADALPTELDHAFAATKLVSHVPTYERSVKPIRPVHGGLAWHKSASARPLCV